METVKILVDTYPAALGERNACGEMPFSGTHHEEEGMHNLCLAEPKSITFQLQGGNGHSPHRASMTAASLH